MSFHKISLLACRKKARLALRHNTMTSIVAILIFFIFFTVLGTATLFYHGVFALFELVSFFSNQYAYVFAAIASLLSAVLLTAPLSFGINALVIEYFQHGKVDYSVVFAYFTHPSRYWCAVFSSLFSFARLALCAATVWMEMRLGAIVAKALLAGGDIVRSALVLGTTVLFFLLLLLFFTVSSANYFLIGAVSATSPMLSYRQCKAISFHRMRGVRLKTVWHDISFLPLIFFSFLLFGVPLLFVLPYMKASRHALALELLKC